MKPKPAHLGPKYGQQWLVPEMAKAYAARRPYPLELVDALAELAVPGPVLEIGAGTGDLTHLLVQEFDDVTAIELSPAMADIGRNRAPAANWVIAPFEDAEASGPYGLIVAAECLHWMEWDVALPKIGKLLSERAVLALVGRESVVPDWWPSVVELIARYSTCREFAQYDLIEELESRGLFQEVGRRSIGPIEFTDTPAAWLKRTHSVNGFSRAEMTNEAADAFDAAISAVMAQHLTDGAFRMDYSVELVWGTATKSGLEDR
ncbi:MAG: class I SAM-dependent methyltransferase [Planctomycetota bacterium]|jgi:SAM-dependent methyltransferase